ncbi:MAG: hypothetical protein A2Z68_02295 [Candidatus Nealsonbacteria bacterium RBG_13_38_11]|uniref:Uncharacterized protein n=1 Tax=Candidatus Nealsonbacteria bacterium RBG_13_38_11 TaxID=1801662 RepID=A0A1G2E0L4_9BACT|nr:MAG: hypothetical protein A2Z68_02295 [Candidatus Nealsonbacteria bacterium RBG_13_38_11]
MSIALIRESQTKYAQGTAERKEDGAATYGTLSFVIDTFSEPWSEKYPHVLIDDLSLGEYTARFAEFFLGPNLYLLRDESIWKLFSALNKAAFQAKIDKGIPKEIIRVSGASFAAANIKYDNTELLAAGDAFIAGELKNGGIFITKDQVHLHTMAMRKKIARLMEEVATEWGLRLDSITNEQVIEDVRKEMWNRFVHPLKIAREKVMNNPEVPSGYPTLNGDAQGERMWQRYLFRTADIKRLLLFTDGFIAWELLKQMTSQQLGIFIIELYKKSGINGILALTRSFETATSRRSHTKHAEATTTSIELS